MSKVYHHLWPQVVRFANLERAFCHAGGAWKLRRMALSQAGLLPGNKVLPI